MGATPILRLAEVSRVHGTDSTAVRALAGVCMEVNAGELRPSWARAAQGSPLLNLAGGLDAPTSGEVFIEGESIGTLKGDAWRDCADVASASSSRTSTSSPR